MTNFLKHRRGRLVGLCLSLTLAFGAAPAFGQDALLGGYGTVGGETQATIEPTAAPSSPPVDVTPDNTPQTPSRSSDLLPFTGIDLLAIAAAGAGLMLLGFAIRMRLGRLSETA